MVDESHSSSDMFSFPSTPTQDFEFGPVTPERSSPADHLFSNGLLLPHHFPSRTTSLNITSRTSSVNSRDSFMSSRSSSARTSSCSDDSDRRRVLNYYTRVCSNRKPGSSGMVTAQLCAAGSKRWQYITPVPEGSLKRDLSERKKESDLRGKEVGEERKKQGRWRRFFRLLLLACKECHAMEPSKNEADLLSP